MIRTTTRVVATVCSLILGVGALSAIAAAPAGADPVAAKRAEADRIARQLDALAERASVATEDYDFARYKAEGLETRTAVAAAELATTEDQAKAAGDALKQLSIQAYMHGGLMSSGLYAPLAPVDLGRAQFYVHATARRQSDALDALRSARQAQAERQAGLESAQLDARRLLGQVDAKRRTAASAEGEQRSLLAQVKGDLAQMVAQEQARRAAAPRPASKPASKPAPKATSKPASTPPARSSPGRDASPSGGSNTPPPSAGAAGAVAEAKNQIGKPYQYGGSGPDTFDCSGLTAWAWRVGAGRSLPHSAQAQYSSTSRVANADVAPGDLMFFGSSTSTIHHVGIYAGGGSMVDAPETGRNVQYVPAFRNDLVGIGRVN